MGALFSIESLNLFIILARSDADAVVAVNPFLKRIPAKYQDRYMMDSFIELQKLKAPTSDGSKAMVARYRLMIAQLRKPSE